jgi:dolichyl-phosphate-mannose--protein O-mannosyl transferase
MRIGLVHVNTGNKLHSHGINYTGGSKQQQTTKLFFKKKKKNNFKKK